MSEELERKYLAVIQESLMEKLELIEENKKQKEKLANISYKKDCELFTKKLNSSDFVVNEQNTKESESESDKYYILDFNRLEYIVKTKNTYFDYTSDINKATIFSYKDALLIININQNKNYISQRVNETK